MSQTIDVTPEKDNGAEQALVPAVVERRLATIFEPQSFQDALALADRLAASSLVPTPFRGKAADVLVAIMKGAEVGLQPMQALDSIAVINGKPALYGDAPLALVEHSGLLEDFREWFTDEDTEQMVAHCYAKRRGRPTAIEQAFSVADAKKAKLWAKEGPWTLYPKRMLKFRSRSFALRDGFPDVIKGFTIKEEWDGVEVVAEAPETPIALPQRVELQPEPASPEPDGGPTDPPAPTAAVPPSAKEPKATQPQRDAIRAALKRKGRDDDTLGAHLATAYGGITELLDLPTKHVNAVLKWIDSLPVAEGTK